MFRFVYFLAFAVFANAHAASMRLIIEAELRQSVYKHISEKLASAQVIESPFPHIVIENILPDDLYEMALSLWPEDSCFTYNGNIGAAHYLLPVTGGVAEASNLNHDQKIFWRIFGEVIVNRYIKPRIAAKLVPYFPLKNGLEHYDISKFDLTQDIVSLRQDNIAADSVNYSIGVHIDQRNIVAAMLLYMPPDNDHQEFGTQFYEGGPLGEANYIFHPNPGAIRLAKTVPYKPNTLVVFMQTPVSWHAYQPSKKWEDVTYRRRLYHAPIFFSPEFMTENLPDYNRSYIDDYFFDGRYFNPGNWLNIWADNE